MPKSRSLLHGRKHSHSACGPSCCRSQNSWICVKSWPSSQVDNRWCHVYVWSPVPEYLGTLPSVLWWSEIPKPVLLFIHGLFQETKSFLLDFYCESVELLLSLEFNCQLLQSHLQEEVSCRGTLCQLQRLHYVSCRGNTVLYILLIYKNCAWNRHLSVPGEKHLTWTTY